MPLPQNYTVDGPAKNKNLSWGASLSAILCISCDDYDEYSLHLTSKCQEMTSRLLLVGLLT